MKGALGEEKFKNKVKESYRKIFFHRTTHRMNMEKAGKVQKRKKEYEIRKV